MTTRGTYPQETFVFEKKAVIQASPHCSLCRLVLERSPSRTVSALGQKLTNALSPLRVSCQINSANRKSVA